MKTTINDIKKKLFNKYEMYEPNNNMYEKATNEVNEIWQFIEQSIRESLDAIIPDTRYAVKSEDIKFVDGHSYCQFELKQNIKDFLNDKEDTK